MNALFWVGCFITIISAPQMLPWFRRRMAARGLSSGIAIPCFLTLAGILAILAGVAFEPHV